MSRSVAMATFMILVTVAAYLPSMRGPFLWDDLSEIAENPAIRTLVPPWRPMFEGGELPHRPLPYFSFAVNYALGKLLAAAGIIPTPLDTLPFHIVNVAIHLINGVLLCWIMRRLLARDSRSSHANATPALIAWLAATAWLVHPLQSQAVSYIYQRIELLAALAALATLASFLQASDTPRPLPWFAAAVVSCSVGMACKEWFVVVPLIVLLADRAFLSSSWQEVFARRGVWHALLFATIPIALAVVAVQRSRYPEAGFAAWQSLLYALNQPTIILWYLSRLVLPCGQSLDHGAVLRSDLLGRDGWVLVPAIVLTFAACVAVWSLPHRPTAAFMILAFLLLLAPTSSILPVQDVCVEHRMYLASALPIVAAVVAATGRVQRAVPLGTLLVLMLAGITASRNVVYRSAIDVWQDAAQKSSGSSRSLSRLGAELSKLDRRAEAVAACEAAVARNARNPVPYAALAAALINADRLAEAVAVCRAGLETASPSASRNFSDPVLDRLEMYRGLALDRLGDPAGEPLLRAAVARRPESLSAREHLARAVIDTNPRESAALWDSLLDVNPGDPYVLFNRGSAVARFDAGQAVEILRQAIAADPENPNAFNNLGGALLALGLGDDAQRAFEACLRIAPDHPQAAANLRALGPGPEKARMRP